MEMTSIIPDQPTTTVELDARTAKAVDTLHAHAASFGVIAAFLRDNPDLPGAASFGAYGVLVPLSNEPDPRAAVAAWTLRAIDAGAVAEMFSNAHCAGFWLYFGAFRIEAYARRELVGERVEVTRSEWQWRLGIEIPEHARREPAEAVNA